MKKILLTIFLFSIIYSAQSQFNKNNYIYTTGEFQIGNYYGIDLNINYVYKESYSILVGYTSVMRSAKSKPNDYSPGLVEVLLYRSMYPQDFFRNYKFGIGRVFSLNNKGTIRLNLTLGVGYTTIREPNEWKKAINDDYSVVQNYSWEYESYNTISFILNPKFEFPIKSFYGFSISPIVQINKDRTFVGIGFGQMIGLLRKR